MVDSLIDGTLSDDGSGAFRELYDAILYGTSWHPADHYYLLHDFLPYCDARLSVNRDFTARQIFARKCLLNTAECRKVFQRPHHFRLCKGYLENEIISLICSPL